MTFFPEGKYHYFYPEPFQPLSPVIFCSHMAVPSLIEQQMLHSTQNVLTLQNKIFFVKIS